MLTIFDRICHSLNDLCELDIFAKCMDMIKKHFFSFNSGYDNIDQYIVIRYRILIKVIKIYILLS